MEIKRLTDLVLVKRVMLRYVQVVRMVRRMGRGLPYHHVALSKVRLVSVWNKKREVVVGARKD